MLLAHILIALASIGYTTFLYARPSHAGLKAAGFLVALTLGTGTYLVIEASSNMLRTCATGLVYLGLVSVGMYAAQKKLATQPEA